MMILDENKLETNYRKALGRAHISDNEKATQNGDSVILI